MMVTRYYQIREVPGARLPVFEVLWSVVDDGKFPLRAFGPASFAACRAFVDVAEQGVPHHEARGRVLSGVIA